MQHAFDELAHLVLAQAQRHTLAAPVARHIDPVCRIDPQLLDRVVGEIGLERSVARQRREHLPLALRLVIDGREPARRGDVVVPAHLDADQTPGRFPVARRIDALGTQTRPDAIGQVSRNSAHAILSTSDRIDPAEVIHRQAGHRSRAINAGSRDNLPAWEV